MKKKYISRYLFSRKYFKTKQGKKAKIVRHWKIIICFFLQENKKNETAFTKGILTNK